MHTCGLHTAAMTECDLPVVLEIERVCFPAPWHRRAFLEELANPLAVNLVLKSIAPLANPTVEAYSCCHVVSDELSILRMAVAPHRQRSGMASRILDAVFRRGLAMGATRAFLEVRPSNAAAIALYRKKGFAHIGRRPHYYPETREDALVMAAALVVGKQPGTSP